MHCMNDECDKDPMKSTNVIFIGPDGDAVCDGLCRAKYDAQKDDFFNRIVDSEELTKQYIKGK